MTGLSPNQQRAARLRVALQDWLEEHELMNDGAFDVPNDPEAIDTSQGAEPTYLILRMDGMLYDLFYKRENDDWRAEFDAIVADGGFWYEFHDSTTLHFMVESHPPSANRNDG